MKKKYSKLPPGSYAVQVDRIIKRRGKKKGQITILLKTAKKRKLYENIKSR